MYKVITPDSKTQEIWFEWKDGNPVKYVHFDGPVALTTTLNEYSDKLIVPNFRAQQTVDQDMSHLYDTYYSSLALKRKNHLRKQTEIRDFLFYKNVTTYNFSDHTTDAKGALTGYTIEKAFQLNVSSDPITQNGTGEVKTKCP